MKKVILTLVAVATMGIANAQLFVGGNIGFGKSGGAQEATISGVTTTVQDPKQIDWEIAPKIGFQAGKMSFGAIFGINGQKQITEDVDPALENDKQTRKYFGWEFCPFFRYNAFEFGNFALFCELQVPVYGGKWSSKLEATGVSIENKNAAKDFGFGVQVVPGLNYSLSDHLNFDLYVNLLALGYSMDKTTVENPDNNDKNVTKATNLWAGVFSLPQHNAISIGFNYKF